MGINGGPYLYRIDPDDCIALLATTDLGRVGLTIDALPAIRPIRYAIQGNHLVFRAARPSRLQRAAAGQIVAFQADHGGAESGVGWTVHVLGQCNEIISEREIEQLELLPLPSWHRGNGSDAWMQLSLERISGERIYW